MCAPIEISGFRKRYKHATVEFDHFIFKDRITLLLGENGKGKSTLLKAMAGLVSYEGTIKGCQDAVYIPETPALPSGLRLRSYLHLLGEISGYDSAHLEELLKRFHLADKREVLLKNLSKGMRQKANLVQGLSMRKSLYLIDEPASGLDVETQKALREYMKDCDARFLCATHAPEVFAPLGVSCVRL